MIRGLNPDMEKEGLAYITAESETYLRGANIGATSKKILIVDEAENFTVPNLRKTLTRLCEGSKAIVIGHHLQTDIAKNASGFVLCMEHFKSKHNNRFCFCDLTHCYRGLVAQTADEDWYPLYTCTTSINAHPLGDPAQDRITITGNHISY